MRIPNHYKVGDKVLYHIDSLSKYSGNPYAGPYDIVHVYTNGTVRLKNGCCYRHCQYKITQAL